MNEMGQDFKISDSERQELLSSLSLLGTNLEKFVSKFYEHFLDKDTLRFIQQNSNESLINMISSSLNIIFSHTDESFPLEEYLDVLNTQHPGNKIMMHHKDLYVNSIMQALIDTLKENYTERLGLLWYKAVSSFVLCFD